MKKQIFIIGVFFTLSLAVFAQQLTHESEVINVEVPVRVVKGGKFVDNLTLDDFELHEDGKLQKIEAVYLIRKTEIERKEEKTKFIPETSRNFFIFFEVTEYTLELRDTISYFVKDVLAPGDNLVVVTPVKTYQMKSQTLELLSRERIVEQLTKILRKDAVLGNSEYRNLFKDLTNLIRELSSEMEAQSLLSPEEFGELTFENKLSLYRDLLERFDDMKNVDQKKLLDFAEFLKDKEGQKYVFLLYQREFIPQMEQRLLHQYIGINLDKQDVLFTLSELFDYYRRDIYIDVDLVKQAFADSSISIHFLFFTKPRQYIPGVYMAEHSEGVYSAFKQMAEATGGFTGSSADPVHLFHKAVEASENYYLIYYAPIDYKRDGKFKNIKIKVKNKNYRISHRAGYFAN
ncbi:MAG TPA: hypothetical protein ENI02_03340 [Candidatus Aminicenantes bacterium]|nr:hypothetical protein [Candidatus Aminicenantes bacterium]